MSDKYNGWTNYQTWAFNLWYDDWFREDAKRIWDQWDSFNNSSELVKANRQAIDILAESMAETLYRHSEIDDKPANFSDDMLTYAIGMINFHEVAGHYIDDLISEETYLIKDFVASTLGK